MRRSYRLAASAAALAAAASLPPAPAPAGERTAAPAFTADEITDILTPVGRGGEEGGPPLRTRGLSPGQGTEPVPAPGGAGSGVLPDLMILFEYGSDALSPEARAQLDELADALGRDELRDYRFVVGGHTDVVGGDGYNEDLSRRRAAAVVSYLAGERGIAAARLEAVGYGERELADPADPASGRNRRVEVRTAASPP